MKIIKRIFENSINTKDFINKLEVAGFHLSGNEVLDVFNENQGFISYSKPLEFINWLSKEEWIKQQQEAREKAQNAYFKIGSECQPSKWILQQKGLDQWDSAGFLSYVIESQTEKAVKVRIFNRKTDKKIFEWFPKTQIIVPDGVMIQKGINAKIDRAIEQINTARASVARLLEEKKALEVEYKKLHVPNTQLKKAQDFLSRPQHQLPSQLDLNWAKEKISEENQAKNVFLKIEKIDTEIKKQERNAERLESVLKNI